MPNKITLSVGGRGLPAPLSCSRSTDDVALADDDTGGFSTVATTCAWSTGAYPAKQGKADILQTRRAYIVRALFT